MSRISEIFKQKKKVLITYVMTGYPSIEITRKAVLLLAAKGADIIELGIPFSDPLSDGVTIQNASFAALKNGITPPVCFEIAAELGKKMQSPLVFMGYYNPIFRYGLEDFCRSCRDSGVSGIIVPDLPPEESEQLDALAKKHDLDLIFLLAPTSTEERIKIVSKRSRSFIYLVSVTGVTGARDTLATGLKDFVARVRKFTDKPLCVGFGISTSELAAQAASMVEGVIVGSKIIQSIETDNSLESMGKLVEDLRSAIDEI